MISLLMSIELVVLLTILVFLMLEVLTLIIPLFKVGTKTKILTKLVVILVALESPTLKVLTLVT